MAPTDHPTSTWEPMQDGTVFYRKQELYSMQWKVQDLSDFKVVGARYGGPLAIIRDEHKVIALGGAQRFTKPQIQVYSSSGGLISTLSWDQGKIICMGWAYDERLVVLSEEGLYRVYDLQGEYEQFSLGAEALEEGVVEAQVHETGLVALTGSLNFLEVRSWEGGKAQTLASSGLSTPPHCWTIMPPELTVSRHVEVLISTDSTILMLDNLECIDQRVSRGPFTFLAPSPNGKALALLTAQNVLWVVSSDFQGELAESDLSLEGVSGPPKQMVWCGNDSLVLVWDALVLMMGPFGDALRYFYASPVHAIGEIDGTRIVGAEKCDFLQRVPSSTDAVFRPGSTSPAATLFDAMTHFERKSPKADENIRSIRPELVAAVDACIDAAAQEWEPYWQKKLLNAASFGRAFLDLYDPSEFVAVGQTLKVLNAARYYEIGIPITYTQYQHTSPEHLIARLTSRNLHLLALRVSSYLQIKADPVLKHWACAKIAQTKGISVSEKDDDDIVQTIVSKFKGQYGVSYADIARRAWQLGRTRLATRLLDHEPRAEDQVPLLLSMKEDRLALKKAIDSGDTDMVYHVLLTLKKRLNLGDFFRLLEDGGPELAPAASLLQVYARQQNRELLRDFYFQDDRRTESAILKLEEAAEANDVVDRTAAIRAAGKSFSEDKDRGFEARMMDEHSKLLILQQAFEKDADGRVEFIGLSINDTIYKCITTGQSKKAEKVRSDWRVPDKRFWYIKLHALTEARDWEGLDAFAKQKRSPIGYEAFVNHLVSKGFPNQAKNFVPRCDAKQRIDLYIKCGDWRAAGAECKERGDKNRLDQLRRMAPNGLVQRELDQIASTMNAR
ncbi:vacuolar protein sorting-associated protein 16 [Dacryopinax primogenitus]|uniref:Probable vacuolar protein sorting-associated protein 16 homolog n=1 Tax=Dacryopinax primogenitus (strain DJM 731) TaxID=1858805 RepID=M5GDA5_DACPD|nr:vacuolar protein sorting-associated protein 16 [Dacryopinax primogenitus]EJU02203.1 vacuolar protein sorting-associated protein 16 [Dacryopinax primogenitus]